ncbi:hypothetical protein BSLG_001427 [Batrachochytrium salamandrivorans]|nr:hypothetical protein BASA84_000342 [Batrachochytrium salamandrivorans]KAJ1344287.1 hypothetical protein BSLG_001427 [Batrachochytrium salamandrivorans]
MSGLASKRLAKELRDLQTKPPVGITIRDPEDSLTRWYISIDGAPGTLYEGEVFTLQVGPVQTDPMFTVETRTELVMSFP